MAAARPGGGAAAAAANGQPSSGPALVRKPLGGVQGYQRLVRLLARAFYAGECPPREEDGPPPESMTEAQRLKAQRSDTTGLGVLLLDQLAKVPGYIYEDALAARLRLSAKNVRKALRYLEGEGLLASESVKKAFRRSMAEATDDPEVEEKKRHETHVYWCIAYPALVDSLRLRLHRVRALLRKKAEDAGAVAEYLCPRCGAIATSLDAARLLDPTTLTFRCEECRLGELQEHVQGVAGLGGGGGASGLSYRDAQEAFKTLQRQFEGQLAPLWEQLERLREADPPDWGSLRDWALAEKEKARRQAARAEALRGKGAGGAGAGAGGGEVDDAALLAWADRAEVQVTMEATGPSQAGPAAPGKELPAWFRSEEDTAAAAAAQRVAAEAAARAAAEEEQRRLQQEYLRAYLAQQQAALAARQGSAAAGAGVEGPEGRESKRLKTEGGYAAVAAAAGKVKAEPGVKAEGLEWEEVKAEQGQQQQQRQQQGQRQQQPEAEQQATAQGGAAAGQQQGLQAEAAAEEDLEFEDF